jgi:16S rRNA processing protein RimM
MPPAHASQDAQAMPEDAVEVGRVLGAWGIKGGIRVKPFAADPQALFSSKRWFIQPPEGPRPVVPKATGAYPTLLRVLTAREQGDSVVATVQDLTDRDYAEALRGARIYIARSSFPTPGDGEFYWIDLIGLSVVNREAVPLGKVVGLIETGPHCVLRIQPEAAEAEERLIPFVDAYVDKVEMAGRLITVDWDPEY